MRNRSVAHAPELKEFTFISLKQHNTLAREFLEVEGNTLCSEAKDGTEAIIIVAETIDEGFGAFDHVLCKAAQAAAQADPNLTPLQKERILRLAPYAGLIIITLVRAADITAEELAHHSLLTMGSDDPAVDGLLVVVANGKGNCPQDVKAPGIAGNTTIGLLGAMGSSLKTKAWKEYALSISGAAVDVQCVPGLKSDGCLWDLEELVALKEKAQPLELKERDETRSYANTEVEIKWRKVMLANQWVCVPAVPMVVLFGRMPMNLQDSEWYTAYTFDVGPGCQLTEAPAAGTSSSHGARGAELRYCMQPVMGGAAPTALDLTIGDTLFKLDADNLLQDALADPVRIARAMRAAYEKYPDAPKLQDAFFVAHICHLVEQVRVERQLEAEEAARLAPRADKQRPRGGRSQGGPQQQAGGSEGSEGGEGGEGSEGSVGSGGSDG